MKYYIKKREKNERIIIDRYIKKEKEKREKSVEMKNDFQIETRLYNKFNIIHARDWCGIKTSAFCYPLDLKERKYRLCILTKKTGIASRSVNEKINK